MIRNFGLPLLLIFPAYFAVPTYLRTFYIPFVALMVFCFLFIISPNDYDNLKLMYYWYSVTAVILSVWLCRLLGRPKLRFLVFLIILCCSASGALTVPREAKLVQRIFSPEEIEAGNFARDSLPPKVLFLSGQYHNQPVLCLAGKPIVLGYDFWIISHGYDTAIYEAIKNDVRTIYDGGPDTGRLLEKYKVDYIYIGPHERTDVKANVEYFDKHYAAVFKNKDITIYDARKSLD